MYNIIVVCEIISMLHMRVKPHILTGDVLLPSITHKSPSWQYTSLILPYCLACWMGWTTILWLFSKSITICISPTFWSKVCSLVDNLSFSLT